MQDDSTSGKVVFFGVCGGVLLAIGGAMTAGMIAGLCLIFHNAFPWAW